MTARAEWFRELASGRARGPAALAWRTLLTLAEGPYAAAMRLRNAAYDRGWKRTHRAGVPVICVGNLTLGGTGKTPLVAWVARWLRGQRLRPALISRGYRADESGTNDEALELEQRLPDVPHVQHADRVEAARVAVEELAAQCLVMDDGFQHRRLHRDLDIVLLDATAPFGFDHVFPRGLLREPVAGLRRAGVVALSRADLVPAEVRRRVRQTVARLAPEAAWLEIAHRAETLLGARGATAAVETLRDRPVAAFCGLGNPAGFRGTLAQCGYRVVEFREYPDHHAYTRDDVADLAAWAERLPIEAVVTTHKDLVKLRAERLGPRPLWALAIGIEFLAGREALEARLRAVADACPPDVEPDA